MACNDARFAFPRCQRAWLELHSKSSTPANARERQVRFDVPCIELLLTSLSVGAVLYTSYLQVLGAFHEPTSLIARRVYPPYEVRHTFAAGFAAGTIQSFVAAPLDALQVRFKTSEMLEGRYRNMWHYAYGKLRSIGPQGIFAGWSLSVLKDSFGYAVFFSTFEYVKAQMYYGFLTKWYGRKDLTTLFGLE